MTNPTPHGQVPEALRLAHIFDKPLPPEWPDMVAAAAELRRQHARIAELEAQIEALGGVQALSAAPEAIAKLRHLYQNMVNGAVRDTASAKRIAEGLLAPAIEALERATPPAEQQAPKETLGGVNGWSDISTAPKDGSRFVAIGYNYGLYSEGRHICVAQWFRGCWMETSDWNEASELQHLTHWLPLPSPPDNAAAPAEQQAQPGAVYAELHEPDATTVGLGAVWNRHSMRDFADRTHALRMQAAPQPALGVGNTGFDHKTAADFLNGKTVSDEAVRKFVQASRWAHDERAALSATLLAMHGVLTSREAEIALLKKALLEAEGAAK